MAKPESGELLRELGFFDTMSLVVGTVLSRPCLTASGSNATETRAFGCAIPRS